MEQMMQLNQSLSNPQKKSISSYKMLFMVSVLHFIIMYMVMYTMVYSFNEIYLNINNVYMTGMMLAPMVVLMPMTMSKMYPDKKINITIYIISALIFVAFFIGMRTQAAVGDKQFITSMIPHHSGAVLMCERAQINDAELKNLCAKIIKGQTYEIEQMKQIAERLQVDAYNK